MTFFENYDEALRAGLKNSNTCTLQRVLKDEAIFRDTLLEVAAMEPGFWEKALRKASANQIAAHVSEKTVDY
ncbi:hypothetical protein ACEPPN_015407 [Leptodophora sp. 'Broadleaf-Isolate-01']